MMGRMTTPVPPTRWDGERYAASSAHHREADAGFLRRHAPRSGEVVVDLGCGSGEFTTRLAALAAPGRVIGIDLDGSMLAAASRLPARPNLRFVRTDATDVDSALPARSVDVVISRAMLHWLPAERHARLYAAVHTVLRPGGVLHLECAAPGNIPHVIALLTDLAAEHGLPPPPPFPDPGRTLELLEAAGFDVADDSVGTRAGRRRFTPEQLTGLLTSQASLVLTRHTDPEHARVITDQALAGLDRLRRRDGTFDQTFVRLEVLVRRPA